MTLQSRPLPSNIEQLMQALLEEMAAARKRADVARYGGLLLKAWDLIPEPKLEYDRAPQEPGRNRSDRPRSPQEPGRNRSDRIGSQVATDRIASEG